MEHINYLYYNGVLQNLQKHLTQSSQDNKDAFTRAIQSIEDRLKEYETSPVQDKRGRFLKNTFQEHLTKTAFNYETKAVS